MLRADALCPARTGTWGSGISGSESANWPLVTGMASRRA